MVGVYKITSPSGKIYIGQSWDIKSRWIAHKGIKPRGCPIVNNSILKYGADNHIFDILHELPKDITQDVLDIYEIFYIDHYKGLGFVLMNIQGGGSNSKTAEETKLKLSIANKGKQNSLGTKMPENTRLAIRKANLGRKMSPLLKEIFDKFRTPENARRMGYMNRGKVRSKENRERISETLKNRKDNKGELSPNAKLTNAQVLEIRSKYKPNKYTTTDIARDYCMSKTNAKDIVARRIWTHI